MNSLTVTVAELFAQAELHPSGPVSWGNPIPERTAGVYVVAIQNWAAIASEALPPHVPQICRDRWVAGQSVIYIGRTKSSLHARLNQFYRHHYGDLSPHRGGQSVLLLEIFERWVYWAPTEEAKAAEAAMIEAFFERTGRLPFANRQRPKAGRVN